jgi:membrane fusion protein, multidrug efflux system
MDTRTNAFDSGTGQRLPGEVRGSDTRKWLIRGVIGAVVLVAAVWLGLKLFGGSGDKDKKQPAAPVKVAKVAEQDVTITEHTLGTVVANSTVQVTARVTGQLMTASFQEGDLVHTGQILFQIDPRPYQASLEQARAQLAKDEASLTSSTNDEKRYTALLAQGAATQQQVDQAVAAAKGFAATVESDKAAIDMAALNVGYTTIRSPIDGKTGPIMIQPGNLITTGSGSNTSPTATTTATSTSTAATSSGTSANPLVVITQMQPVKVSFSLPQSDLPRIQQRYTQGQLIAAIDLHVPNAQPLQAKVDFVGNAVSNTTGTIELRATYPNADSKLVPGQLVDMSVALAALAHTLVVPHDAVNAGPAGSYVWLVDKQSKAQILNVDVLNDDGTIAAIKPIKGKLKPGDQVITDGQLRVVPGAPVAIKSKLAGKGGNTSQAPAGAQ